MGIASIFYVAAALLAPLREVVRTLRGESSLRRWLAIGRQFSLAVGIVASIVLLYVGIDLLVTRGLLAPPKGTELPGGYPNWTYAVAILVVLILGLALTAWVVTIRVRWTGMDDDMEEIARAYRASVPSSEGSHRHRAPRGRHRAPSSAPALTPHHLPHHDPTAEAEEGDRPRGRHLGAVSHGGGDPIDS